jgi:hypothetical protein
VTEVWAGQPGLLISGRSKDVFSLPPHPDWVWGPPTLL